MRLQLVLGSFALALGCGPGPTPTLRPSMPPAAVSPERTAKAPAAAPPAATTVRVALTSVTELPCELRLFTLSGKTFGVCGKGMLQADEGGSLQSAPQLAAGLELDAPGIAPPQLVAMAGEWPGSAWAATTVVSGNGNSSRLRLFRWRRDRWTPSGLSVELGGAMSWVVFPWLEDGMVALAPTPFGPTRVLAGTARPARLPALTLARQSPEDRASYPCKHALIAPEAALELSPGDVMVFAGQLCGVPAAPNGGDVQARHLGFERLRAGEKQGELALLPAPSGLPADVFWNVDGAAALSATDALVGASGSGGLSYLARWDGQAWRREAATFATLTGLWARAGTYWATDAFGGAWLWRRDRWLRIDWRTPVTRDAAEGSRNQKVTQLFAPNEQTTWLVQLEERGQEVTSRVYVVQVEP
ncbi:MAG: hypothetical protein EOO73_35850 [Myxococcales bacterium]|nr:MAG: hypothetical protein EOO73_35850 [Myxococcales bacterium]